MEKESLIKVGVLSLVILAIAIPILTTCMAGLQKDGHGEYYDIPVKGDPETDDPDMTPLSARDMMEYAKEKGATSWRVEYHNWSVYSITLYKGSKIIEEKTYEGEDSYGGAKGTFIYDGGYSEITYHSATPYMTFAQEEYVNGTYDDLAMGRKFVISCEGRNGTIEVYPSYDDTPPILTKNVKMNHAWIPAGYEYNPDNGLSYYEQWNWVDLSTYSLDYQPKFINYDDIHWIGYIHEDYVYLHGEELIGYIDGVLTEGTVSYEYTEEEDSPVKTLTAIHMSYNGYDLDITEDFDTITPAHLVYKEPYVGPTLGALLSTIPIVALAGIGLYIFHKFKSNEE